LDKKVDRFIVHVLIFSGRPNPSWELLGGQISRFAELCLASKTSSEPPPASPSLGYRGFRVTNDSESWDVFDGHISYTHLESKWEKEDVGRALEKYLLTTKPETVLLPNSVEL